MTKLLIIKSEDNYIRVRENDYELCTLEKATVFPMSKLTEAKSHAQNVKRLFKSSVLYMLRLEEIPFIEESCK